MTHPAPDFLPGLELSRLLYEEAVRPLLDEVHPGLRYAAARVGTGSEVLGFDTPRSADHEWGPRLQLFLTPEDAARHTATLHELLRERLPKEVRGWPTHFRPATADGPIGHMTPTDGPVDHRVDLLETDRWLTGQLGPGATAEEPTAADWLAMPQQRLAEVTGGAVFHDGPGALTAARHRLAWYPDQVWRYLLACQWQRVSQEEAFVGRCSEAGDELGSAVTAARLVRDLMRLTFLLERRYAPYGKWLGSAFARLPGTDALASSLRAALAATTYPDRERHLGDAYRHLAARQNATGLTGPVDPALRPYHDRPYQVLHAERFTQALTATLTDPALRALPLTGSIDQQTDNTDVLTRPGAPTF
ncbi:DUF4037 domain-containing protein [Streptomyces albidoflavus]|uniref:DUF4037 domain-containing protein n=1 Tax=Streptomyces albidoflavus TaxID=1886 RepID=UPI0013D9FBAC|nr:DUF4037 domain-containing protein [Streptomyces albidoflavus]